MKKDKAASPDDIKVEQIKILEEFGVKKLTEVLNEIYDSERITEGLSKSILLTLPKNWVSQNVNYIELSDLSVT